MCFTGHPATFRIFWHLCFNHKILQLCNYIEFTAKPLIMTWNTYRVWSALLCSIDGAPKVLLNCLDCDAATQEPATHFQIPMCNRSCWYLISLASSWPISQLLWPAPSLRPLRWLSAMMRSSLQPWIATESTQKCQSELWPSALVLLVLLCRIESMVLYLVLRRWTHDVDWVLLRLRYWQNMLSQCRSSTFPSLLKISEMKPSISGTPKTSSLRLEMRWLELTGIMKYFWEITLRWPIRWERGWIETQQLVLVMLSLLHGMMMYIINFENVVTDWSAFIKAHDS